MPDVVKNEFIGPFIAKVLVEKGVDMAIKKGVEIAAKSHNTSVDKSDVPAVTEIVKERVAREVQSQVDHKFDQEPFYKSRNVWGAIVGVITAIDLIQNMWFDGLPNTASDYLTPIGVIIAALTPLYSRYIAKKPIGE